MSGDVLIGILSGGRSFGLSEVIAGRVQLGAALLKLEFASSIRL